MYSIVVSSINMGSNETEELPVTTLSTQETLSIKLVLLVMDVLNPVLCYLELCTDDTP